MNTIARRMARAALAASFALAWLGAAEASAPQGPTGAAQTASADEVKPFLEAMAAIGNIIADADRTTAGAAQELSQAGKPALSRAETSDAPDASEPAAVVKPRSARNSVVLITSGAAAGAALGAATGRGPKAAAIGAAVGGLAGLIYDRLTYKNPGRI